MPSNAQNKILDAVQTWSRGYWLLRETSAGLREFGIIDGLLIPVGHSAHCMSQSNIKKYWKRCSLIGVEVKTNRPDFLRGLKENQFQRYKSKLSGLYIATFRDVCKTSEIPKGIGHLVIHHQKKYKCVCQRHPKYQQIEYSNNVLWNILFDCFRDFHKHNYEQNREFKRWKNKMGDIARGKIFKYLNLIQREFDEHENK